MPPMVKLLDKDGNEVVTNENGAEALKKEHGYKDAPKSKPVSKKDAAYEGSDDDES